MITNIFIAAQIIVLCALWIATIGLSFSTIHSWLTGCSYDLDLITLAWLYVLTDVYTITLLQAHPATYMVIYSFLASNLL